MQRHDRLARGRDNTGNEAQQIVDKDKEKDASDEGLKALVAVADDLVRRTAGKLVDHLRDLLHRAGFFNRKRQTHNQKEQQQTRGYRQFESKRVTDRLR